MDTFLLIFYVIPLIVGILTTFIWATLESEKTKRKEVLQVFGMCFIPLVNILLVIGSIVITFNSQPVQKWLNQPIKKKVAPKAKVDEIA